ncbi:hypothetical protein [Streptomyces sp. NPDC048172]|uniref:hypothetical protein n=1 Tax=Streptomyces sp. NPDC048172 TaxID=3365505 RepID=UPI003712108A
MAWDEWEQLKASSAADQGSPHMQLNGTPDGDGPRGGYPSAAKSGPNLVVNNDSLGALGNMAYELRERIRVDSDHARPATFDASIELFNDGLDMGSALTELHDAWSTKTTTLKDACGRISNHLDYTKAKHAKDEVHVQGEMSSIAKLDKWMKKD